MSKVVTTTLLPDVAGGSVTLGGTGDSVVVTGNDIRTNALQDAGGNAVFTSNGSGVLSGMNSAFAGAMKPIQTQTASNAASVSFTTGIDSTYDVYMFKFMNINPATNSSLLQFQVNAVGETGYNETMTTTFFRAYHMESDGGAALTYQTSFDQAQGTSYQWLTRDTGNVADEACAGELYLFAPSSTTYVKHFYSTFITNTSDDQCHNSYMSGYVNTTSAINAIDFKMNNGSNFDGIIKMYGISKS